MDIKELSDKILRHPLLSEPLKAWTKNQQDEIARNEVLKTLKKIAPLATWDRIPLVYDNKGNALNTEVATEAVGLSRAVADLRTDLGIHFYMCSCGNGSGKSFSMYWLAVALLTNSHPNISLEDSKNPIGFMSNSRLIQEEFPKSVAMWLGDIEKLKSPEGCEVVNPKGEKHIIKALTKDGKINGFRNITLGRDLMTFTYNQNWQALAGYNFSSFLIDEFGEIGKSGEEENTLTKKKFYELLVRVGRNGIDRNNFLFCLFFTIIPSDWVYELMDSIREGKLTITDEKTGDKIPFAKVLDGFSAKNNPYINRSQQKMFESIAMSLGDEDEVKLRIDGDKPYDPDSVFPPFKRPVSITEEPREYTTPGGVVLNVLGKKEVLKMIQSKQPGWKWICALDPGVRDKFVYLIAAAHPILGCFIIDSISGRGLTLEEAAELIKQKEKHLGINSDNLLGRYFDRFSFKKTSMESTTPVYEHWQNKGIYCQESVSITRDYDAIFTLIGHNLLHYSADLTELDKEIKKHRTDRNTGKPYSKGGDDHIDAMRYIADVFHKFYYKSYHLAQVNKDTRPPWKIKREIYEFEQRNKQVYSRRTETFPLDRFR